MLNDEPNPAKLPKRLVSLIIFLVVLLVLFLLVMLWYDRKLNHMQSEEQKLRRNVSASSFKRPSGATIVPYLSHKNL